MRILLVNTNRMEPPIAPVGLDYVGAVLEAQGHVVNLLDLCLEARPLDAVERQLDRFEYQLIGLTFRNTDDCYFPGRQWFLPDLASVVQRIRARSSAQVVLGGVGFSVMPEAILAGTQADAGVSGEGEFAFARLAAGEIDAGGVIWRTPAGARAMPPSAGDLGALPAMRRELVDNARYYRDGGQIGFETKRGCAAQCIYCADPIAKGRTVRVRPPGAVAGEVAALARQGIVHLHTCDAEFNRPIEHALAVCEAFISRSLGRTLRWYAYCAPTPFPDKLARAMREAGCVGINFGSDSGDEGMLRRLGRDFSPEDLRDSVERCRRHGLASMVDLLLGGPGETTETLDRTIQFVRDIKPDRAGLSVGVRVYPGTPLARLAARAPHALHGPGAESGDFVAPAFYIAPELGVSIFGVVNAAVGSDPRFFFSDPTDTARNYNYSGNDVLVDAIRRGYRGAYWDILRRLQDGLPPE